MNTMMEGDGPRVVVLTDDEDPVAVLVPNMDALLDLAAAAARSDTGVRTHVLPRTVRTDWRAVAAILRDGGDLADVHNEDAPLVPFPPVIAPEWQQVSS